MNATNTILHTIGITQSWYPLWMLGPEKFDIMATLVLGVLAVWAREVYKHYDPDSPVETSYKRFFLMIFPGALSGFMGGEIAGLTNNNEATWLYALVIGYGGAPVLNMLVETVVGIMQKALTAMGADFEKQQARREEEKEKDEKIHTDMRRKYEQESFKQEYEALQASPDVDKI
jgi:carbon starvation protein CstA